MSTATKSSSSNGTSATATSPAYEVPKVDAAEAFRKATTAEVENLIEIASRSARATCDLLRGARFDSDGDVDGRLAYLAGALTTARMVTEYVDHAANAVCQTRVPVSARDIYGEIPPEDLPF